MGVTAKSAIILDIKELQKTLRQHLEMVIGIEFQLVTFAAWLARGDFWLEKWVSVR